MPTNYTSRLLLIGGILLVAVWSIFPGMFKGQFKADLKPGIDMEKTTNGPSNTNPIAPEFARRLSSSRSSPPSSIRMV